MQRNFYQPLSLSPEKQREEERQRAKLLKKYPKLAKEMVRAYFVYRSSSSASHAQ